MRGRGTSSLSPLGRGKRANSISLWRSLLLALFLLPAPCLAGPAEDAAAAYKRGDYSNAMRLYRSLADQGDARAQNSLGRMYLRGQGASRDYKTAMRWFRRAAALGIADAQYNLGKSICANWASSRI